MADILIVDDDLVMLSFLSSALKKAGHQITTRDNGLDALTRLRAGPSFDLLLSDIIMPGMDGIELSREASKLYPDLKIMFITGFSAVSLGDKNPENAGKDVMTKPFHLKELVIRVEQILADSVKNT